MTDPAPPAGQASDLLRRAPPAEAVEWARRAGGESGRVLSVEPLRGGMSHANHLIRLDSGGAVHEVVLRRWVRTEWLETDPECSPSQEAATYDLLASSAVPVPRLIAADFSATDCDVPALLLTRAPGRRVTRPTDLGSFLGQLARVLPVVHAVDPDRAARTVPPYRPYYERDHLDVPRWTQRPSVWQRAIELATATPPGDACTFIHRDYHPGNLLWSGGAVSAVVDWVNASIGSSQADVGHCRMSLVGRFGMDAADAFRDAYLDRSGDAAYDPYYDIVAAVGNLPDAADRSLDEFVSRAVALAA